MLWAAAGIDQRLCGGLDVLCGALRRTLHGGGHDRAVCAGEELAAELLGVLGHVVIRSLGEGNSVQRTGAGSR
ncbi:hypothetical protein [Haloactinomyces albus]|uniref:Uncharacterized protein n=1 Tax=Haloactinomyces albus TaxID=1352928 RepID=A0AAE4CNT4_9ACTN|nr:hypothetical protein [Haloactinomyces albus]MDR7303776.1 hypothetical protein [Haloactinomyces albus]